MDVILGITEYSGIARYFCLYEVLVYITYEGLITLWSNCNVVKIKGFGLHVVYDVKTSGVVWRHYERDVITITFCD